MYCLVVHYLSIIFSKEDGDKELEQRHQPPPAIKAAISETSAHSYDPFPITHRMDGSVVNPFPEDDDSDFDLARKGEEEGVGFTVIKEEFLDQPKSIPDSGVHSDSNSLQQSASCYGSSSSVFQLNSTGSIPSPSGSAPSSNYSDHTSDCLPDSTTADLSSTESTVAGSCQRERNSQDHAQITTIDPEISSSSETGNHAQVPSGQAPLGHALSGQTPLGHHPLAPFGQAPSGWGEAPLGQAPSGQVPSRHAPSGQASSGLVLAKQAPLGWVSSGSQAPLGHGSMPLGQSQHSPPSKQAPVGQPSNQTETLGRGLPAWERDQCPEATANFQQNSEMPIKLELGMVYYQGDGAANMTTSQNFYSQDVYQNEGMDAYQQLRYETNPMAMPIAYQDSYNAEAMTSAQKVCSYNLNTTAVEQRAYPQASDVMACLQDSTYNIDTMVTAHTMDPISYAAQATRPQASCTQFNARSGHPPSSVGRNIATMLNPFSSPLLTGHDTRPTDTPNAGVWPRDAGSLPLLTGEDLDMLDLMT